MLAVRTSLLAAVIALVSYPGRGSAQGLYYRTIPLGERAIGLGGSYTGIADDPSATYYNPGGLLSGGRFMLLGSLSSIVLIRQNVDGAFGSQDFDRDLQSSGTTTLPHFIGTVVKFGKKAFGDHRYAIAYSSFEVAREAFNVGFSEIDPAATVDLRLNTDYRMRWWGISFAARVKKKLSLGLSAFLSNQRYNYSEDIGLASGGTLGEDQLRVGGESATSRAGVGIESWSFVFRLGALYRINSRWQIGFMFQPPSAPLKETGSVYRRLTSSFDGAESNFFLFDQGDFKVRAPIPLELRTGVEYKVKAHTTLSFDFAITGGVRDRDVFTQPAELESVGGDLGAYFANSTERRWTPNASIGAEHLFGKVVVAGGLFTNLSAAPDVPETATEFTPDQVNQYGASFAVGVDTKGYRLTLGATGYFGRGDALSVVVDREAKVSSYERTKATTGAIVLYVAGAVSVASRGAKEVQHKYQERKAGKEPEPEPGRD